MNAATLQDFEVRLRVQLDSLATLKSYLEWGLGEIDRGIAETQVLLAQVQRERPADSAPNTPALDLPALRAAVRESLQALRGSVDLEHELQVAGLPVHRTDAGHVTLAPLTAAELEQFLQHLKSLAL